MTAHLKIVSPAEDWGDDTAPGEPTPVMPTRPDWTPPLLARATRHAALHLVGGLAVLLAALLVARWIQS